MTPHHSLHQEVKICLLLYLQSVPLRNSIHHLSNVFLLFLLAFFASFHSYLQLLMLLAQAFVIFLEIKDKFLVFLNLLLRHDLLSLELLNIFFARASEL